SCGDAPARSGGVPVAALPWIVLAAAAAGLEAAALVLGGRSPAVPTLSTVVDRALVWRPVRFLLLCGWLSLVLAPELAGRPALRRSGGRWR
ncbi:MAG: hypothetical protein M0Z33_03370, partial [Actinomycetota bacterium]|nr:hypothetical protein [Actinomycetota bacterium]